eukprot:CAMPEP_0173171036 /NCGR_PEP_ID=MMETSP1141-20130122/1544_1 /TAXON_ID=483371 /ORGANISM="non described non described, Strain CCMP2298" /LENGTH=45 /DNA_ID= /DNA_START= /DNA_END= /DNA_ORIENTATION=
MAAATSWAASWISAGVGVTVAAVAAVAASGVGVAVARVAGVLLSW